jgi:hypothetical protein
MAHSFVQLLLIGSLILFAVCIWRKDVLPQALRPELLQEPQQRALSRAAFETTVNDITYTVQPLYIYDLYGLVVSSHDADTWWDNVHAQWNDKLNVMDLCVVWGKNLETGAYREASFSSSESWCYWESRSSPIDNTASSNNHLLADNPLLAKKIRAARIGDQVHFRGYLAEYSHNHGFAFKRGTSTSRNDTGAGACETVYVQDFEILSQHGRFWRLLMWFTGGGFGFGIVLWFCLPVRFKH